ncbi:MAG: tRNA uridine-5-carboxymethylaminomethyl(34) synthesis enzyme MnmG [Clostridiales bacterium]|nr:tRNA uridine-5-carboxymethylaminomethyl(34) synthesis enzyme MnmG [Clostridiales bacterium]
MRKVLEETYDAVVVGAGHAGCEAALALARLGFYTALFTVSVDSIALMPCNPNVGGSSKGHLVREVDALGGEMGKNIDATFIQSKMLNKSKGPAVHSLRAQADKKEYSNRMRRILEENENITIKQAEVTDVIVDDNKVIGVKTYTGSVIHCQVCVLCTGTYLKAKCITGEVSTYTGPNGLSAANHLSDSLVSLGLNLRRFKTGTPARIDGNTVDFSQMEPQYGDEEIVPFSFTNEPSDIEREQIKCYLTYTNEKTHQIIRDNLDRSPLYSGMIKSTGPRYCPSIEDKVVRFADKNRHQVFIEPEGLYTSEVYIGGMSSSMPEDVQYEMYRSVKGLENAKIVRNAYAIEYDCIDSLELKPSLECKKVEGLFSAGQANGSSGYEEAAAQGIIAGINAARKLQQKDPIILDRSQAYIGVLIDDLVTKGTNEPYRMMTSRAEYRLILRQDNADLRLTPIGYEVGLISKQRYDALVAKEKMIHKEMERLNHTSVGGTQKVQKLLDKYNSTPLNSGITLAELIRRPELDYDKISSIDENRNFLPYDVCEQVNINIKYEGYISRQMKQVRQFKKMEQKRIPSEIDYSKINSLRIEAVQKLTEIRPQSVGQAARISGVSPADISVLLVYLENYNRNVSRETSEDED